MEQIESIAFLRNAPECDMKPAASTCAMENHQQEKDHENTEGCCEDLTYLIEGQDELKEVGAVSLPNIQFVAVLCGVVYTFLAQSDGLTPTFKEYSPPIIERDIPVLVQSFLI